MNISSDGHLMTMIRLGTQQKHQS